MGVAMSREKNLKLLKKFINKGRLSWDYGDEWYSEDFGDYYVEDNTNLESSKVTFRYEISYRDYMGDDSWDGEKGEGETTLGILLDFILNRKFGNKEVEISFEQLKKYFKEDESYQAVFNVESGEF